MCGIAAILRLRGSDVDASVVRRMADLVRHRGPDGDGVMYFVPTSGGLRPSDAPHADWRLGLAHTRLSIIDLSDAGLQPMAYGDDLWLIFNGEIYNYIELRRELEGLGRTFRSRSDSEVVLAAYAQWGSDAFRRLRGMWAIVIADLRRGRMIVSRDRMGIKPLYIYRTDGALCLFSEPKQATALGPSMRPNDATVARYLLTGYDDAEETFFTGVDAIPAGTWMSIDVADGNSSAPTAFWHPEEIDVSVADSTDAAKIFRERLREATRIHLRSDVPVGCALSGGLDSSAIVASVNELSPADAEVHTFTATFPGSAVDERRFADAISSVMRVDPHYVTPTPERFLADLDDFVWLNDEPVGGLNQYAAFAVARITRESGVPVILNGQGGDELLSSYWQSFFVSLRAIARKRPGTVVSALLGSLLPGGNPEAIRQIPVMARRYRARRHPSALIKLRDVYARDLATLGPVEDVQGLDFRQWRLYELRRLILPRLLKWDDRNFMAFSVESRTPFLDHEVIEACLSFAPTALYHHGWTKEPLRRGFADVLPRSIARRRTKVNFAVPQDDWLCGGLRPAIEQLVGGDSPAWRYIDPKHANDLASGVWQARGAGQEQGQALLRLLFVDRWMRRFDLAA